jgi:hypothetical protein
LQKKVPDQLGRKFEALTGKESTDANLLFGKDIRIA